MRDLHGLLTKAVKKRAALRPVTNALRLVNGAGDGLDGLLLDQYNRHFSAQIFHQSWRSQAGELTAFLQAHFDPSYFILKDRTHHCADSIRTQVLIDDGKGSKTIVYEYGVQFAVDVHDGLNAGLFLDMRANRHAVGRMSEGKRVLNCFAYTCSFGVHAHVHGVWEVVNVDVSKKMLERGRENYVLNGLIPAGREFIRADVRVYVKRAVKKGNCFDLVVLDPPSFARTDKSVFQVKKDLPSLMADAAKILNPGGVLFVSTNFNAIGYEDLQRMLEQALDGRKIQKCVHLGQDKDFPGSNTFKESYLAGLWAKFF